MWIYRRIFTAILVCGLLFGGVVFIKLRLNEGPTAPEFLPNVPRFRTSRVCSQRALVLVSSSPTHAQRRQVIRESWGHPTVTQLLDISVAFGVGSADSADVQRSLDWEAEIYGDLFQDASLDTGAKSATRVLQLMKIARSACAPLPEFVMKTEDDVFVNILYLGKLLEVLETQSTSNTMWCLEWNRNLDRTGYNNNNNNNETWVVLKTQFGDAALHPRYCVGTLYLMTGRALDSILRRHDGGHIGNTALPEDVYVTGMLTKEAGTALSLLGERFPFDDQRDELDAGSKLAFAYLGVKFEDGTKKLWRDILNEELDNRRRSDVGL